MSIVRNIRVKRPARWQTAGLTTRQTAQATERAAQAAGGGYAEILRGTIVLTDSVATRELVDGITVLHRRGNTDYYREDIALPEHAVPASEGTRPHWPNIGRLARWVAARGLLAAAVYPIARHISRYGTRPKHFLRQARALFEVRAVQIRDRLRDEIARLLGGP